MRPISTESMPPVPTPHSETPDASFRRILASVGAAAAGRAAPEAGGAASPVFRPLAGAALPVGNARLRETGGAANWQAALAWLDEQDEQQSLVETARPPEETVEAVLAELGLSQNLTDRQLAKLRRLYMWTHHPDRQRESQRAGATRRVAIANMLLDRARAELARRRAQEIPVK